jgi:hypothetical protein
LILQGRLEVPDGGVAFLDEADRAGEGAYVPREELFG